MRAESGTATEVLTLKGVSKTFVASSPLRVLEDIDLSIYQGEFVSLIGPSGCGKSTLLAVLAGLLKPTTGSTHFTDHPDKTLLGEVAYMPQKDLLLPWRSLLDNTIIGMELRGWDRTTSRRRALDLFPTFGLAGFEDYYPANVSGGMRQRAAFLRTLLADRSILLLDEPFGALDALTRANLQVWLLALWESLETTIVLVTHDVEEALLLSDRICVMTKRPGYIKEIITVPWTRPRNFSIVTTPEFTAMRSALLNSLYADSPSEESR